MTAQSPLKYQALAASLIQQIQDGVYPVGDRMPSVRALARRERVSIATVNAAYGQLMDQGWVEARPKSGYFVTLRTDGAMARPRLQSVKTNPQAVTTTELVLEVQRETAIEPATNFSCAVPDLSLPINGVIQKTVTKLSRYGIGLGDGYDSPEGSLELRHQIARRALEAGIQVSPDALITTIGAQNAMSLALSAVTKPGDIVAVESPCYHGLFQLIESAGLKAIEIPSDPDVGLSVEALRLALQQWPIKTVLSISSFSNPLGCTIPDEHKREIVDLLVEHDAYLIEDDIYGELQFSGRRPRTFKAFDPDGRVLWCSSVSKTMDPQLRVGWIAPGRFYDKVLAKKYSHFLAVPGLMQAATAEVMSKGLYERHLQQARTVYAQRAQKVRSIIEQSFPEETRASTPTGGFVLWLEMPKRFDATEFYRNCRRDGIRIAPGEIFSASSMYRHCFRLNYAYTWSEQREAALYGLGAKLKAALVK